VNHCCFAQTRSHNDDRPSKFIIVAENMKKSASKIGIMADRVFNRGSAHPLRKHKK
jgi:hypothetical protein